MKRWSSSIALLLGLGVLVLAGCQNSTEGPSVSDYEKQRAAILEKQKGGRARVASQRARKGEAPAAENADSGMIVAGDSGYHYDPEGKRDPFRSFILDRLSELDHDVESPLEKFDLSQLDVAAVVWKGDRRRVLIVDPSGQAYIVKEGDHLGKNDGQVLEIRDSSLLVREAYVDFHGEKTTKEIEMRIRQSQGG